MNLDLGIRIVDLDRSEETDLISGSSCFSLKHVRAQL